MRQKAQKPKKIAAPFAKSVDGSEPEHILGGDVEALKLVLALEARVDFLEAVVPSTLVPLQQVGADFGTVITCGLHA